MRKAIVAANWKMNKTPQETVEFLRDFLPLVNTLNEERVDVVISPSSVCLTTAQNALGDRDQVRLAAQNMHHEMSGAYTGEISPWMLRQMLITYVILGHSERRSIFGETDEFINKKVLAALKFHLKPILCIGETLAEREAGKLEEVLRTQLTGSLAGVTPEQMPGIVIAYEPVWAIGTGVVATTAQAQEAHAQVRQIVTELYDGEVSRRVRIQYGGSVKPSNAAELMSMPDVDGFLVGGASLESGSFWEIVQAGVRANA